MGKQNLSKMRREYPMEISFYKPSKTLSVSLTGKQCALNCSHCGKNSLTHMIPIDQLMENLSKYTEYKSILVSGGSNLQGSIPLMDHIENLKILAQHGFHLNIHTGLANDITIDAIQKLMAYGQKDQKLTVSYDFITHERTIREVYGLSNTREDYISSYQKIKAKVDVVPHICIGLLRGKLEGEFDALESLASIGCEKLVFIIFTPLKNTSFEHLPPPSISDIKQVFEKAVPLFPNIPIHLGCMRPKNASRAEIDLCAIKSGIQNIVMPSKEAVMYAKQMGYRITQKEECCIL
jgi:lipoyl synthase